MASDRCILNKKSTIIKESLQPEITQTTPSLKHSCEEVTEQYVICNGAKYIRDLKDNEGLKRDVRKIEIYLDFGKQQPDKVIIGK